MLNNAIIIEQLINGLVLGCIYGLIAIGYTMVYGIIGMINFAHGDIYMISAYLTAIFFALFKLIGIDSITINLILTLLFTVLMTSLHGWSIERIAYRPLRDSIRLAPLISAIGVSIILQNYVRIAQSARSQAIPAVFKDYVTYTINDEVIQVSMIRLSIILIAIISMIFLHILIQKTTLGRAMRATQQDMQMASRLGININQIIPTVFVIGSIMAAIAGVMVTLNYGSFDFSIGFIVGIKAFTAAVLGGIGSLPGAMLGGIILGMAESLFSGFANVDYKDVFAFSVLILVLVFKPSGLLGRPEVEKV